MKNYPVSRKDNLVVQEIDGEVLIYDLAENKAFCLNKTSALVWQACDGNKSTAEISKLISHKLNSPATEDLVWFALDQLKKEKLIENSDELPNNFAGISRREVIKKVGLGSMIALPIVASLVAPAALQAQSADCMVCVRFHTGEMCSALCETQVGICQESAACSGAMGTLLTCLDCQSMNGACAGGPTTCVWSQN
jgi:Coenzyme PQQ synthesis protein D (PqqD)